MSHSELTHLHKLAAYYCALSRIKNKLLSVLEDDHSFMEVHQIINFLCYSVSSSSKKSINSNYPLVLFWFFSHFYHFYFHSFFLTFYSIYHSNNNTNYYHPTSGLMQNLHIYCLCYLPLSSEIHLFFVLFPNKWFFNLHLLNSLLPFLSD